MPFPFPLHLFGAWLSQMWAELTFICICCHLKITSMHYAWKSIWTEPGNQCQGRLWQQVMLLGVPSCQDPQLLLEVPEGTSKWLALTCVFLMFWLSSAWYGTFWGQGSKKPKARAFLKAFLSWITSDTEAPTPRMAHAFETCCKGSLSAGRTEL